MLITKSVFPAKAGTHPSIGLDVMQKWIPAFAGKTELSGKTCQ